MGQRDQSGGPEERSLSIRSGQGLREQGEEQQVLEGEKV